ncbi:MAG: DUF1203 domain-containing protein [Rhizobiaceae bacterium]
MLKISGMNTSRAQELWQGGTDDHGNPPELAISDGQGNPCRHCLQLISEGDRFLIISHRPFDGLQPYAEQGPVFLHAEPCEAYSGADDSGKKGDLPPVLKDSPRYLLRGYDHRQRIVYGTGTIAEAEQIKDTARNLLEKDGVAFVHIRSATNNCWQARVDWSEIPPE